MKRKLKKLEQVLSENPGYSVDYAGNINFHGPLDINSKMLFLFGTYVDVNETNENSEWKFDESWFEDDPKVIRKWRWLVYRGSSLNEWCYSTFFNENPINSTGDKIGIKIESQWIDVDEYNNIVDRSEALK